MDFQLFYRYGALLCALGLIEAAPMIPYDVTSVESGSDSADAGLFCYFFHDDHFKFVPQTYLYYGQIKDALLQRGASVDALTRTTEVVKGLIADSVREANITNPGEGTEFFYRTKITSYSTTDEGKSLKFQYEGKQVKITFSDKRGVKDILDILIVFSRTE